MSDVPRRLGIVVAALAVGAMFVAGLFLHGRLGGALLLVTDAMLINLTRIVWDQVRPQGRPFRIVIIVAIAVLAVVKLVHG
jgi:hypothetical protein